MRDSGNSADERILFDRLPGGKETFAMVIDFCYGIETFKVRGQLMCRLVNTNGISIS